MLSRRDLFKLSAVAGFGTTALSSYAVAEAFRERVTHYRLTPPGWTPGLSVRLIVLADLHVCDPWMSLERLEGIVAQTNRLDGDAVLLLGDYVVGHRLGKLSTYIAAERWAGVLGKLKAPLGVHAVLGNHDWWDDAEAQARRGGPTVAGRALEASGIPVYENRVVRLEKGGHAFWLAGLGDQLAFRRRHGDGPEDEFDGVHKIATDGFGRFVGADDLPGTLRQIGDDAPVVLMAHEPDIFPDVPQRVALTVSGHTHGGQIRILGYAPFVPSRFGMRYIYGHIVEDKRNLIVSGGLGCSGLPVRFGALPEIVVVDLGQGDGHGADA